MSHHLVYNSLGGGIYISVSPSLFVYILLSCFSTVRRISVSSDCFGSLWPFVPGIQVRGRFVLFSKISLLDLFRYSPSTTVGPVDSPQDFPFVFQVKCAVSITDYLVNNFYNNNTNNNNNYFYFCSISTKVHNIIGSNDFVYLHPSKPRGWNIIY